jgi:hypothetical protein
VNITEANAAAKVVEALCGTPVHDLDKLRETVEFLADRINKALHAGPRPEWVHERWPGVLGGEQQDEPRGVTEVVARHVDSLASRFATYSRNLYSQGKSRKAGWYGSASGELRAEAANLRSGATEVAPELRLAIDADCPKCGWAERWFSPSRQLFGCSKCSYTSTERTA